MRIQAKDMAAAELRGPLLDDADIAVAVFHGCGEIAGLKRRPHALVLAARHFASEDQRFRAAADGREQRAHERFARLRRLQRLGANFPAAGLDYPECARRTSLCRHLYRHL
jgi:hypothetical protein